MTAATYTSDLADIYMWESTGSVTSYGGGGSAASAGPDYAIEGTNAVAKPTSASERGFLYASGGAFTIGADDHFFSWVLCSIPGLMDTRDNRGLVMCIGDDTSNFVKFHLQGNDTLPYGGIQPYAVRFVNTTLTNFRTLVGTPGTSPTDIGCGSNITGTARFDNTGIDASRIGTGYDILNGTGADPEANLAGIATDDAVASEGILITVDGGYSLQGKLRIGSASTACEFLDLNTNINLVDTRHSLTDFTEILVENASSILTLTNINLNALGTNNPGRFEMITSTATATLVNVGFIDFGVSIFSTNSTLTNCRWISAALVTAGGATFTGCSFDNATGTVAVTTASPADAANISNSEFVSDGTGNGLEITGTAANITLSGIDFTGYSTTVDADKAIYVNIASGSMTINISGGSGVTASSHVRTAGATITVSADVTVTFTGMKDNTEVRVYENINEENTDISFTATDTISSASSGFGGFAVDDIIRVSGSDSNDDNYTVVTASASTLTVLPATITTESAAASILIKKTNQVELSGIENATAGSTDNRSYAWSAPATTVVDYVLHNWNAAEPFYQTVRTIGYVVPGSDTDIGIQQQLDRNAE